MSFALGVFDVFTYAATGSLYVSCLAYVLDRLGWVSIDQVAAVNGTVLLLGLLLLSYLAGHVAYRLGAVLDRVIPGERDHDARTRSRFVAKLSGGRARMLAASDPHVLLAAIEIRAREASLEVTRLRAVGLALRNSVPAMVIAAGIAAIELFTSTRPVVAGSAVALLLMAAWMLAQRGRALRTWAIMKTYELAYWIPEIVVPNDRTIADPLLPNEQV